MKYSLIIIGVSVIISILIGAILVFPKYQEYASINSEIKTTREKLENQQSYLVKLEEVKYMLAQNQDLIDKIDSIIPDDPEIPSFLNFVSQAATNNGVSLDDINWHQKRLYEKDEATTAQNIVNAKFSGSYFSFINFLIAVEDSARLVEIESIDFNVADTENSPDVIDLELKIHSY